MIRQPPHGPTNPNQCWGLAAEVVGGGSRVGGDVILYIKLFYIKISNYGGAKSGGTSLKDNHALLFFG